MAIFYAAASQSSGENRLDFEKSRRRKNRDHKKSNSNTCELVYIQQAKVDNCVLLHVEHEHSISTAPYKRSKAPV
jgi:hypothetical protein